MPLSGEGKLGVLANQLGNGSLGSTAESLKEMEDAAVPKPRQQFAGSQQVIGIVGFSKGVLVDGEGLVHDESPWHHGPLYGRNQRAMEVAEDQDAPVGCIWQQVGILLFQVHLPGLDLHPKPRSRTMGAGQGCRGLVTANDRDSLCSQEDAVVSITA